MQFSMFRFGTTDLNNEYNLVITSKSNSTQGRRNVFKWGKAQAQALVNLFNAIKLHHPDLGKAESNSAQFG